MFVVHAQYELHVRTIYSSIANLNFDDLTVAALTPPISRDILYSWSQIKVPVLNSI